MFATLNLQLISTPATLEPSNEPLDSGSASGTGKDGGQSPFSQLLGMRKDPALEQGGTGGQILPESGKPLPPLNRPTQLADGLENSLQPNVPVPANGVINPRAGVALDRELGLAVDLEVAYLPAEIALAEATQVTLLPMEKIAGAQTWSTAIASAKTLPGAAGRLGTDALTLARPAQSLASEAGLALATQTQILMAPVGDESGVLVSAEGLVRTRIMPTAQQAPVATVAVADGAIESTSDDLMAPLARTVGAIVSAQKPDFRVAGLSSTQNSATAHLTPSISPLAAETALGRQAPLLEAISTPVRDAAWGQKLGEQVITLTNNQIKTADIKLTPADLGPLRVRISLDEGAASITFVAQSAVTREAIEQALPRLREMMAESGLSLGQTDVSDQGVAEGNQERDSGATASKDGCVDEPQDADLPERRKMVTSNNLLDTFA